MLAITGRIGITRGNDMSKTKAINIASYFVKLANKNAENDLTNLKLQKILYFAQATHLGKKGVECPLFEEQIEAWVLGPVVREVYNTFSVCGASPITLLDIPEDNKEPDGNVNRFCDDIWNEYGKFSAAYLVTLAHKQKPWKESYVAGSKRTISLESMAKYFAC
jgi:uncharacterized phage-associated protein